MVASLGDPLDYTADFLIACRLVVQSEVGLRNHADAALLGAAAASLPARALADGLPASILRLGHDRCRGLPPLFGFD
jgi:hypothetical protein